MNKTKNLLISSIAATLAAGSAHAMASVSVDLSANNGARWTESFSATYAELGKAWNGNPALDGAFSTADDTAIGGGYTAFAFQGNWTDVGTLTLDGNVTGTGVEAFNITGATFDFSPFMADDDSLVGGYTTAVTGITTGTIEFTNGAVSDINLDADLQFVYDFTGFGIGPLPYNGSITIGGAGFVLDVTENYDNNVAPGFNLTYEWDANGTAAFQVVPEPQTYALMFGLFALAATAIRRRAAKK